MVFFLQKFIKKQASNHYFTWKSRTKGFILSMIDLEMLSLIKSAAWQKHF